MNKKFGLIILAMALFSINAIPAMSAPDLQTTVASSKEQSTVMVSVSAKTINKGELLTPTAVQIDDDSTAWSVLKKVLDEKKIKYEVQQSKNDFYVVSIDGIATESDDKNSGWMYSVNGVYGQVCANQCKVKKGDKVEWNYTTNLGKDLGAKE
ncbi:hypothetical protein AN639_04855 [Candidatus Epulonipiscium fishelsonii]|uniref:Uncharacterized protein n=1 Tax=Candidatus Epulonipiscium fishelsonii TaxID=77094 RepID=A0ACC8XDI6_9FIRM|nr:hypothetical protein AN639_04855 [Epulopiscium sp. SCG-B05WGA-EpuloA1]ONI40809.1 hypothetical protein AN396_05160 [Epulopiscium sp. SCG-B11WGA-EpuloA1]